MKLSGQIALVTGAGRGIGRAIAQRLAAEGARLVITARTTHEIETVSAEIAAAGGLAIPVAADGRVDAQVAAAVDAALSAFGAIDVLVNNAGVLGPIGPFAETDLSAWTDALDANLGAVLRYSRHVVPHMIEKRRGSIVNVSGGGATQPRPNFSAYATAKTAIVRFSETLARELEPYGVRVNAVAPGPVDTQLQNDVLAAGVRAGDEFGRVQQMRHTGEGTVSPALAAELVAFLASSDSEGLTGKLISAPHDPWRQWAGRGPEISRSAMFTLRRLDPFTLRPIVEGGEV